MTQPEGHVVAVENDGEYFRVAEDVSDLEGSVGEVISTTQVDCCGAGLWTLQVANPVAQIGRLVRYKVVCADNPEPEYVEQGVKGCGAWRGLVFHEEEDTVFY